MAEIAETPKKSSRKLVTLPPDLAERVERFRETSGATSESDALKMLIEDGLKLHDTAEDLFQRCETSTANRQGLAEIMNLVTADHPLVDRTILDSEALLVILKTGSDEPAERFRYSRSRRDWEWQIQHGGFSDDNWEVYRPQRTSAKPSPMAKPGGGDLDDDIPF